KQVGFTEGFKWLGAAPVGLGDNPHAKPLGFEEPANHRHTKTRVIYIGITADDDNVASLPTKFVHLCTAHWQKRCGLVGFSQAMDIGFRVGEKVFGGAVHAWVLRWVRIRRLLSQ